MAISNALEPDDARHEISEAHALFRRLRVTTFTERTRELASELGVG